MPGTPTLVSSEAEEIEVRWEPAYDDGGAPIKEYQLSYDMVEGTGAANIEDWQVAYTGTALT